MKKKIFMSVVALMLFAFSIAVFAYTTNSTNYNSKTSCCAMKDCCKDGVCKMNHECCKNHDSCPMKSKENVDAMEDCPMHKDK